MISSREVLSDVKGTLEEWSAGSYVTANSGPDRQQYRIVQLDEPGLVFEYRPADNPFGEDAERFRIVIGVQRA